MTEKKSDSTEQITALLLAIILIGGFIIAATVELVDCPKCHNDVLFKYFCSNCGGDGRVTILQYLVDRFS